MSYTGLDFTKPFDPSGYTQISPTQLASLVGGLGPIAGVTGLTILTTDVAGVPVVPSVATYPKLASYLWIRIQTGNTASLYLWNPNGSVDPVLSNWQLATLSSIPAGSISGYQIGSATITASNIASVNWSSLPNSGAVGGVLSGSLPNPGFANSSISTAQLIAPQASNEILVSNSSNTTPTWSSSIIAGTSSTWESSFATSKLQQVQVNASGSAYQYSAHNVLQIATFSTGTQFSTTTSGTPVVVTTLGAAGSMTFTPLSTNSTIIIEAWIPSAVATSGSGYVFIYVNTNQGTQTTVTSTQVQIIPLAFAQANSTLTPLTVSIRVQAPVSQTIYTSPSSAGQCVVKITEFI